MTNGVDDITLIGVTVMLVAMFSVTVVLYALRLAKGRKYKKKLHELDVEKNKIESTPIMSELSKIEGYLENEKLNILYTEWKDRFNDLKDVQISKITDMLLEADYTLKQMDYKTTLCKIAKLEMELYKVRTNAEFLLDEIKEVTTSEERNRANITRLKTEYRELYQKFFDTRNDFGEITESVSLQFENIKKRFEDFERVMDNNQIQELNKIVASIDDMLKHMTVVLNEMPQIVLMGGTLLPNKIKEVQATYDDMVMHGYPLDYLNVEETIEEANKKISDIMERAHLLNMEDSILELKVLLEYFDGLFNDFEKEKVSRKLYEDTSKSFSHKLAGTNKMVKEIFDKLDEIKNVYDLNKQDMDLLNHVREELSKLNSDYQTLLDHTGGNAFAYSKLVKELEFLVSRLTLIEERLETTLDTIGGMKEDEARAKEQISEVKNLIKSARIKIRDYNLPVIPDNYYVEYKEAENAINDAEVELRKTPISINVLNTRVDTARDLGLKLLNRTKQVLKDARLAEMAIVYGNRFRSSNDTIDKNLAYSEMLFFKGDYRKSLELSINSLNKIEPGILDKLKGYYENEKN